MAQMIEQRLGHVRYFRHVTEAEGARTALDGVG